MIDQSLPIPIFASLYIVLGIIAIYVYVQMRDSK
jgi:hypothetical protein